MQKQPVHHSKRFLVLKQLTTFEDQGYQVTVLSTDDALFGQELHLVENRNRNLEQTNFKKAVMNTAHLEDIELYLPPFLEERRSFIESKLR